MSDFFFPVENHLPLYLQINEFQRESEIMVREFVVRMTQVQKRPKKQQKSAFQQKLN